MTELVYIPMWAFIAMSVFAAGGLYWLGQLIRLIYTDFSRRHF